MKKLILSAMLLVSTAAFASDWEYVFGSDQWEDNSASAGLAKGDELLVVSANVGSGKDGKQRLYIEQALVKPEEKVVKFLCEKSEDDDRTVLNINGTNVQFSKDCIELPNGEGSYISLTPISDAGVEFVLKQFRQRNSVTINIWSVPVSITAKGFNDSWNNFGGDAL
ncbi:hypothetical protein [Agarivorans sp. 1_MG-2023]|uniref:hypothetical protein n=1 Tax=Agarivorans sp. 1_MG-2023 TaxID=3062634 RepID=UPI0026E42D83|nr:hypothetical protein [Agarivorans sp. 1_MG-2023]MDO6763402.1 hypothetical protein [Agarivorans sp. 1_MG-2023]